MDRSSFYEGKTIVKVEWWLSYCSEYPDLDWARLRVFSDGSADAAFAQSVVNGFDNRESAANFLSEDEYMSIDSMNEEDEGTIGVKRSALCPPLWGNSKTGSFKYLGTY